MQIVPEIAANREALIEIRRDLHAHPEIAFEEWRTAEIVAAKLRDWGVEVHTGLAKTGVVGTLINGDGPSVGLRADMDALPIDEANTFVHRSRHIGRMHACGHDGHTTMLLAAAQHLANRGGFNGTIHFIFQPAEENAGGARVMMNDGLFEQFPVDAVFGMHNWPGLETGKFAVREGPMMASLDCFDIVVEGKGTHGALPHHGIDAVLVSAHLICALQSIVSRNVDPLKSAVVSVTMIHGGEAHNILPQFVRLGGGIRCFEPALRSFLLKKVEEVAASVCAVFGARSEVRFVTSYPAVVNEPRSTQVAIRAARAVAGNENVVTDPDPVLGSEDFAYMLEKIPGCYLFIGNGTGKGGCMIHNPSYDFNDDILTLGASYWVRLAQSFLAEATATGDPSRGPRLGVDA